MRNLYDVMYFYIQLYNMSNIQMHLDVIHF